MKKSIIYLLFAAAIIFALYKYFSKNKDEKPAPTLNDLKTLVNDGIIQAHDIPTEVINDALETEQNAGNIENPPFLPVQNQNTDPTIEPVWQDGIYYPGGINTTPDPNKESFVWNEPHQTWQPYFTML